MRPCRRCDAGNEIGHTMRRGLLAVSGKTGDLVGLSMIAGTILVFGDCGIRHGAGMRRGTIGLLGPQPPPMLPSFRRACRFCPTVIRLVLRALEKHRFEAPRKLLGGQLELYHGDMLEGGKGEILVRGNE